ncbi:sensor histidine kinase [Sediminispirochaeta smaragdinae]|uniref:histidine kinase n=1 Tax=Sediminispirochaeta smaragdinae (strain DSM 11293 / JCM 15392 / SEBR 4228) TaxID=573413 RepID=E1R808_SEDSS|nr:histidine kinase dimerization/phosphoacceptor domain -containing protein [Sediminispirochaeta smaragdinae]ADK82863.1 signal transduction histidine kinase [Sediminispirochaeta smaragdinae DSM 11293]
MHRYKGKISRQFAGYMAIIALISTMGTALISFRYESAYQQRQWEQDLKAVQEEWLPLLSRAAWLLSTEDIHLILLAVSQIQEVDGVRLDLYGQQSYQMSRRAIHEQLRFSWPVTYKRGGKSIEIGRLTLFKRTFSLGERIERLIPGRLIWEGLKIALIIVPVFLLVRIVVTNKIDTLSEVLIRRTKNLNDDTYREITIPGRKIFSTKDEFDQLVAAFNQLLREIRKERDIREKNETTLIRLLKEKDVLLREVHHRVKNNLQIIISLIGLQSATMNTEEGKQALEEAERRIKSLALVHEQLYLEDSIDTVDLRAYIDSLLNNISLTMNRGGPNAVMIRTSGDHVHLSLDRAIPLALILNELCTNAFEHAFPDGTQGRIEVFVAAKEAYFTVTVTDNGKGFSDHMLQEQATGFGLTIVQKLIEQIDATLSRESKGKGTIFSMSIPYDRSIRKSV